MKKKTFYTIHAFGQTYKVRCEAKKYINGNLAIEVIGEDGEEFGVLTSNMDYDVPDNMAFVKTYSENEGWAKELADKIGTDTGCLMPSGYVVMPLYEFDLSKL